MLFVITLVFIHAIQLEQISTSPLKGKL